MKQSLPLAAIHIDDSYWNRYTTLIPNKVIPYQWKILNDQVPDALPSYCLKNFRIAAGEEKGERKGTAFLDSDAAKWLEAIAYSLASRPDPELEKTADDVIALIGRAQEADGYLNTYFTLLYPQEKWKNLTEGHELYCAGHFIEAAVAYYETTGKKAFLEIVCRLADLICKTFGPADNQIHGYPGHQEIELALVKLYHTTGKKTYLDTAKYFVDQRGTPPNYFLEEMKRPGFRRIFPEFSGYDPLYSQSHFPVRKQDTAEGHAVRATYMYCAMADLAEEYEDGELLERCKILWNNIVKKRMYITGSIGSSGFWERFTIDYDLPNDINYSETCASIGLALFGLRMARITADASYIDTVERALYNTIRAGISLEGDRYFYVNPLEVQPDNCLTNSSRAHIKPVRQKWFDVACCPTNVARTFTSLGQYIYFINDGNFFINLFIQNEASFEVDGKNVSVSIKTDYPKTGNINIGIKAADVSFALHIRIPDFAEDFNVMLNGAAADGTKEKGYFVIKRSWSNDEVLVSFTIKPRIVYANPKVHQNCRKIAIARGPEIFCFEEADNGSNLAALSLDVNAPLEEQWREDLLGGVTIVKAKGKRLVLPKESESFSEKFIPQTEDVELNAVPYGSWGNRNPGEMMVWIQQQV
ncbi:MAG: glycoside hydrolase family 127 protein [Treponema sp.]|nr:glycoside hydrolase family 127 protein [Treponema sp.]